MFDDQNAYRERFEWGLAGVQRLAALADFVVIVDVLSFTTAADIAVGRGALVHPFPVRGEEAERFAAEIGAELAGARSPAGYSLSPASLTSIPAGTSLVLPSPNGATLSLAAAEANAIVLLGCLRNATAVARACRALGERVAVIAAGERWRDAGDETGRLRPGIEDLIGAGAILAALSPTNPSPEARIAIAAFEAAARDLPRFLAECASGRELTERGFADDVALAAALDVSETVPRLDQGALSAWHA